MTHGPLEAAIEQAVTEALTNTLPAVIDQLAVAGGPRAYTVDQVAHRLSVSRQSVYRLIRAGRIVPVPYLHPVRIAARTLEDFLAAVAIEEFAEAAAS